MEGDGDWNWNCAISCSASVDEEESSLLAFFDFNPSFAFADKSPPLIVAIVGVALPLSAFFFLEDFGGVGVDAFGCGSGDGERGTSPGGGRILRVSGW